MSNHFVSKSLLTKLKKINLYIIVLFLFSCVILFVSLKINFFRYNNFDFGKFDLGNMSQMLWNTLHGRFMYLTDYFGTNLPRWSMSHVDPIMLLFLPIFFVFQHSMTLVVIQLLLIIFSSLLIYKIAQLELKSRLAGLLLGISFLVYPATGFLIAWTGFHGVSVAVPFFLGAFYLFEKMHFENSFTKKNMLIFWVLLLITMSGKEQLSLYILLFGLFVAWYRNKHILGIKMAVLGLVWFIICFFVIIPAYAHYRIDGFSKFAEKLDLDTSVTRDVERPNYFISRYEEFGDSYLEIMFNMATHPAKLTQVFFGGDNLDNLRRTFQPVGYMPLAAPLLLIMAAPDFLMNYLTTAGGIGTAEIYNHRISMIIPIIFISSIFAIDYFSRFILFLFNYCLVSVQKSRKPTKLYKYLPRLQKISLRYIYATTVIILASYILLCNIYTTFIYNNPIYLWLTQAATKRLGKIVFAKTDPTVSNQESIKIGTVFKLTKLEDKDRDCANKVVDIIPTNATVSGPDYLGAHLSLRETYAIFPALYDEADYVIVDVFSKKILRILDIDVGLVRNVVADLLKHSDYNMVLGCGNLFVFKKSFSPDKDTLLPIQERFEYSEKYSYEIFQSLTIVDYELPTSVERGSPTKAKFTYVKRKSTALDNYLLFMSFVDDRGEVYQMANLPSFALNQPGEWSSGRYYIEKLDFVMPNYLNPGRYKVFIGMSNNIRTRSIYLGDMDIL